MSDNQDVRGLLETFEYGPGFVLISGWISAVSGQKLEEVMLSIEGIGEVIINKFTYRPDLNDAKIAGGYAAFRKLIWIDTSPPEKPVVYAVTTNGSRPLSGHGTSYIAFKPTGAIDIVEDGKITGWVMNPSRYSLQHEAPVLTIGGSKKLPLKLTVQRVDLGVDCDGDELRFGFVLGAKLTDLLAYGPSNTNLTMELSVADQVLDTKAIARTTEPSSVSESTPAVNIQLRAEDMSVYGKYLYISGWVAHQSKRPLTGTLQFTVDGAAPIKVHSLDYRGDLMTNGIADGNAAFYLRFERGGNASDFGSLLMVQKGNVTATASLDKCRRRTQPLTFLEINEKSGVVGSVFMLEEEIPDLTLDLNGTGFKPEWRKPNSTRKFWSSSGVLETEFSFDSLEVIKKLIEDGRSLGDCVVVLKAGDTKILSAKGRLSSPLAGNFEVLSNGVAKGWMVINPDTPALVDVYINGVRYNRIKADKSRPDLKVKKIATRGGGFIADVRNPDPETSEVEVSIRAAQTGEQIAGSPKMFNGLPPRANVSNTASLLTTKGDRGVSIIIPIYNAADDVKLCLDSLCAWTTWPARVIIIDDCSPDARVTEVLSAYKAHKNIKIYVNEMNLGFTRTVNKGMKLAGDDDVIFLNSDTILTPLWIQGLRAAAYSAPRIATVTPLSNNAGVFSAPEMNESNLIPSDVGVAGICRTIQHSSHCVYPRVPTGNGFCMYIRSDCIREIGGLDEVAFPVGYGEENDFCMRATRAGFEHIMDDRTYVYHKRSASFGEAKSEHYARGREVLQSRYPEYSRLTSIFSSSHEILGVRWRIRKAVAQFARPKPRVLYVISTETGGTPQTNRDLMLAVFGEFEPWLMRCNSTEIQLRKVGLEKDEVVETFALREPINPLLHRSNEYDDIVTQLLVRYSIEFVHARHLGWHGLGLQDACRRVGIPFILSLHDFYCVCPTVKLLDEESKYCGGACTSSNGDCSVELWQPTQFPQLKNRFISSWRAMFGAVLRNCDALVTTSPFARDVFFDAFPDLKGADFRVIPHGRDFSELKMGCNSGEPDQPIRVLVPGNISRAKGADLIQAIVGLDKGASIVFHILGDAGRLKESDGLVIHGKYARSEFQNMATAIKPNVGAVFSIWPETYCHTLTEMWAIGLPVLGMAIGAVGERIEAHGGGWTIPATSSPEETMNFLRGLHKDRGEVKARSLEVMAWQSGYGRLYTTETMAAHYRKMYQDVVLRKRWLNSDRQSRSSVLVARVSLQPKQPMPNIFWEGVDQKSRVVIDIGSNIEVLREDLGIKFDEIELCGDAIELEADVKRYASQINAKVSHVPD